MKWKAVALAVLLIMGFTVIACAADDYKKHPGYVDFEKMGFFGESEAAVEVILKGSILKLVREATRDEDPELSDMINKLQFIHVQTFPVGEMDVASLNNKVKSAAKQLEKSGWEVVVRVRDKREDEQVYIYLLPTNSDQIISGLVVMVIDEDEDAVFINIVGDLDPAQIGKLGNTFGIDKLDNLENLKIDVEQE
ncbi:MAG: DUF4252 domain-containing protein [Candidatus Latescibacterota bacterium]